MRQTIRLTECELIGMIQEVVNKVLSEVQVKCVDRQIYDLHGNG